MFLLRNVSWGIVRLSPRLHFEQRWGEWKTASEHNLVHFDHVALRVMEKDLVPSLHRPRAVVGERDAAVLEAALDGCNVIRAKGDMPLFNRIDGLSRPKADAKVLSGEVHLGSAIGHERDLTGIPFVRDPLLIAARDRRKIEDFAIEPIHLRYLVRAQVYVMQLRRHAPL